MDNISKNTDNFTSSPEYLSYQYLKHWAKADDLEQLLKRIHGEGPLFSFAYQKTSELYARLPLRQDGHEPLTHPLNTVLALEEARLSDEVILSIGLLHDFVEESVDLFKKENNVPKTLESISLLDAYEVEIFGQLQQNLETVCDAGRANFVIDVIKLLTRHKRDYYYRSISNIYLCNDLGVKEAAILVKLADRMHNILSIECFDEEERLYHCFKNLFILNNTKKFLLDDPEHRIAKDTNIFPTELLFKRCAKATYDAFLKMCQTTKAKGIADITSMLQLAFKKFALEKAGVWQVTKVDDSETHLMRLFHGVVRKYDAKLHHERQKYDEMKGKERDYCRKFFFDYKFSEEQIGAIIDYKDAYSMKELVADLLYQPDYVLHKFLSTELDTKARILE